MKLTVIEKNTGGLVVIEGSYPSIVEAWKKAFFADKPFEIIDQTGKAHHLNPRRITDIFEAEPGDLVADKKPEPDEEDFLNKTDQS